MGNTPTSDNDKLKRQEDPEEESVRKLEKRFRYLMESWGNYESGMHNFQVLFPDYVHIGEKLYKKCMKCQQSSEGTNILSQEEFITFGSYLLGLTSLREQQEYYFSVFTVTQRLLTKDVFCELLQMCYSLDVDSVERLRANLEELSQAMTTSLFGKEASVEQAEFVIWCNRQCPRLLNTLHSVVCAALCGDLSLQYKELTAGDGDSAQPSRFPEAVVNGSHLLSLSLLWSLNSYIPLTYTSAVESENDTLSKSIRLTDLVGDHGWQLLYDSNDHGLSINRFENHVLAYAGATVVLVQLEGYIYCLGSDTEWREKSERWGGSDCFLLQVSPQYRLMLSGSQLLYLNIQDRKYPKGIQVGKDSRTNFLNINEDFMTVKHYGVDLPLQRIEVWGCSGRNTYESQMKQRKWEHSEAEKSKNRKLKMDNWKDNPDRQLLEMGGVTTEHTER